MSDILVKLSPTSADSYRDFLKIKSLPRYRIKGHTAYVPEEYAATLGIGRDESATLPYDPLPALFDYQGDIARLAIRKRKFAVFAACGMGKCLIALEFLRHCAAVLPVGQKALYVCPPMVIKQTLDEAARFYGSTLPIERVRAADLPAWTQGAGARVGITNYEAISPAVRRGNLGCLVLDESSCLKSHYGKWGTRLVEIGKGVPYKLCLTGTPAPNDRIEYATTAVFLDQSPTVNAFLARYFVNRGETNERWELKAHALRPFYRSLSHWCIFLESPATYGWKDNVGVIPPIEVHVHDVPLTEGQRALVCRAGGDMYGTPGGIVSRAKLSQLAKGRFEGEQVESNKAAFIRALVDTWPDESTLIWCKYNAEQDLLEKAFPGAASMRGETPEAVREKMVADFQAGRARVLISKEKILGFGINLQRATRQVFSACEDSYEKYHQCVKRSNRIGSTRPLSVHIPVTPVERAMVDNVLRKARQVDEDTREQERIFKEVGHAAW